MTVKPKANLKNIAKRNFDIIELESSYIVLKAENLNQTELFFQKEVQSHYIQIHFCLKGGCSMFYNNSSYKIPLMENVSSFLYNPNNNLPIHLVLQPQTKYIGLLIAIKKFHSLFSSEAEHIGFLNSDNKETKYYDKKEMSPNISLALNQLFNYGKHKSLKDLYYKAKLYETLSLYFVDENENEWAQCPFLRDEKNVLKIKQAKEMLLEDITNPPSLTEISEHINLSLKKLKEGFKNLYGDSLYSFLLTYKMDKSRELLESGLHNVNEVSLMLGYSTASHFISAFKKKYGVTPKKYLSNSVY